MTPPTSEIQLIAGRNCLYFICIKLLNKASTEKKKDTLMINKNITIAPEAGLPHQAPSAVCTATYSSSAETRKYRKALFFMSRNIEYFAQDIHPSCISCAGKDVSIYLEQCYMFVRICCIIHILVSGTTGRAASSATDQLKIILLLYAFGFFKFFMRFNSISYRLLMTFIN
jgi:hypothetical protein